MKYNSLYQFTENGLKIFEAIFYRRLDEEVMDLDSPELVQALPGTSHFSVENYSSAKDMAKAILSACGTQKVHGLMDNIGLWAWLTFVLRDVVFPEDANGMRKLGEVHRWYPSPPGDYQKSQRHLVRMPVMLLDSLGESADHLLCGPPNVHGDVREQLTAQQDMFHERFQSAAKILYFDNNTGKLKRGAGGKGDGSPRNLRRIRRQLDVTWNLFDLSPEELITLLPAEFNRFKPKEAA